MNPSSETRGEVQNEKAVIGRKLETLDERLASARDRANHFCEHHAQERPWMFVGVAASAGFVLGLSRVRLPLGVLAGMAWQAIPAGLSALVLKSLREADGA